MKAKKGLLRAAQVIAIALVSWLLTPQNILPSLLFAAFMVKVCIDLVRRKSSRFVWVLVLIFVFAGVGVVHDATVTTYASARCRDGWYSYSEHRSGTCSWHHGVAVWRPRVPPWWEKIVQ